MTQTYWLADRDPRVVVRKVMPFHTNGLIWNAACPMVQTWYRNKYAYYSNVLEANAWDTSLMFDGEEGELVRMLVPEARSLVRQLVTLVTKQQLSFKAMAEKSGSDVVMEKRLGDAVARMTTDDQELDTKGEILTENAFISGMSFLKATWRTDKGEVWSGTQNSLVYTGKVEISHESVETVLWNWRIKSWEDQPWVEVRTQKNRWDLIAQFPKLREAILALPPSLGGRMTGLEAETVFDEDLVDTYELYARPTPALPQGRMTFYSDEKTIYFDGVNGYGTIPVEPMIPERIGDFMLGYPIFSNLLPCQEMLDHSLSAIATNQSAHAVQNVAIPRGAGVSWEELAGMNWFTYTPQNVPGGGKPEALQLTQSSPETFKFAELVKDHMQNLSNITAALRGQPPAGVTSGRAIATLVANAIEFMDSTSKAYQGTMERTMMHGVNAFRRCAKVPRMVQIAGPSLQSYSKEFIGSDLDPIKQIKLSRSNPMLATIGGRTDLAEMMAEKGWVKNIQHFMSILNGDDPVETMFETELSEEDLMRTENEWLMEGRPVLTLSSDKHPMHIRKHMGLLNDPNVRANNARVKEILEHCMDHYQKAKTVDPMFMAMVATGQMPAGGPPPPPGAGGPPGPGGPGGPPSGPGEPPPGHGAPPKHIGPPPTMSAPPPAFPGLGGLGSMVGEGRPQATPAAPASDALGRAA